MAWQQEVKSLGEEMYVQTMFKHLQEGRDADFRKDIKFQSEGAAREERLGTKQRIAKD